MGLDEQLALDLPQRVASGRDDFLVADSNAAAVRLVDEWPRWPTRGVVLVGPAGSGKSHLAQVWQARSAARILPMAALRSADVPELLAGKALALENAGDGLLDQTALFHALNFAQQHSGHVLITSRLNVADWQIGLADLASRLKALPVIAILPPDDALLRGVLVKLFADRQIAVDEGLINYILLRMPRSLDAARQLVGEVDSKALAERAEVTRNFVAKIMGRLYAPNLFVT